MKLVIIPVAAREARAPKNSYLCRLKRVNYEIWSSRLPGF